MKQQNPEKLLRSQEVLKELKEARGGSLLNSHQVMGNDPNLVNAFLQQYLNCNKRDVDIPEKIPRADCNGHRYGYPNSHHHKGARQTGTGKRRNGR